MVKIKYIVAITLALIGLISVGRLFVRWEATKDTRDNAVIEPEPDVVRAVLGGSYDTMPSADNAPQTVDAAVSKLRQTLQETSLSIVPQRRQADLVMAFRERFNALHAPSFERDEMARVSRGRRAQVDRDESSSGGGGSAQSIFAYRRIDIQSLEVRTVYERGREVASPAYLEGFRESITQITGPNAFPLMESDPASERLDIVEIRIPMETPVPPPKDKVSERRLIGFLFAWHQEREQWIPWALKQYGGPNSGGSYPLPF